MKSKNVIRLILTPLLFLVVIIATAQTDNLEQGRAAISNGDFDLALRLLKPLAKKGNPVAQNAMGVLYHEGWGVEQNYKAAFKWFEKAAKRGNAKAQVNLGRAYDLGLGVKKAEKKALEWFRRAAEQNYPPGQVLVGAMYATGSGVEQDYLEAFKWYSKAAEQNEAEAQRRLGLMYSKGQGVEQNNDEAVRWYSAAGENGNVISMLILSDAHRRGLLGLQQDPFQAGEWYDRAVQAGLPDVGLDLNEVEQFAEAAQAQWAALGQTTPAPFMQGYDDYRRLTEGVRGVGARMDSLLLAYPEDVRALVLRARVGHLESLLEPVVFGGGEDPPDPAVKHAPMQALLDRALALDPKNAEVHYWKARFYGINAPVIRDGRFYMDPVDLGQAIHFVRRAVELAPANTAYREALATYLMADQKFDEAARVLDSLQEGPNPMAQLLADWDLVPLPENAEFLQAFSADQARMAAEQGQFENYPMQRMRVYLLHMTADEIQEFYRSLWPDFEFFAMGPEHAEDGELSSRPYAQLFYWQGNTLTPAVTLSEIEMQDTPVGLAVILMEIRNPDEAIRAQFSVERGEVFCMVTFMNTRPVP